MGQLRSERGLAAAVAWSTKPFFTRVLPFDPWTILFWHGVFAGSLISVFLVVMRTMRHYSNWWRRDAAACWSHPCPRSAWSHSFQPFR